MRLSMTVFRVFARKDGPRVRLYSRPGNDLTRRFPLIVDALSRLRSRSCIIDGEAVACDDNGVALFDLIRHHRANESIFLYAFALADLPEQYRACQPTISRACSRCSASEQAEPSRSL
jgi:ATP-dependent DNA ligase